MIRKNLIKKVAVVATVAAMAVTALPVSAMAASYKAGTYTEATANLYIPKKYNKVRLLDAYFTTTTTTQPSYKTTGNATIEVDESGNVEVNVPLGESGLGLISMPNTSSSETKEVDGEDVSIATIYPTGSKAVNCTTSGHANLSKYTYITVKFNDSNIEETKTFTFTDANSHAKISLGLLNNDSLMTTPVVFEVDMSDAYQE